MVAVNALVGLASHARAHNVNWRCGPCLGAGRVVGAFAGSSAGKAVDGQHLLLLFALLMLVIAGLMFRNCGQEGIEGVVCNRDNFPKGHCLRLWHRALSGFFGIWPGLLIVLGLVASTAGWPGSGHFAGCGSPPSASPRPSTMRCPDWLDWPLAGTFIVGGGAGQRGGNRAVAADGGGQGPAEYGLRWAGGGRCASDHLAGDLAASVFDVAQCLVSLVLLVRSGATGLDVGVSAIGHHVLIVGGAGRGLCPAIACCASRALKAPSAWSAAQVYRCMSVRRCPRNTCWATRPGIVLLIRPADFWQGKNIDLLLDTQVTAVDPAGQQVTTADGRSIGYGELIWAMGW